ncbi:MAG: hypothetical protein AB7F35_31070 [Acetobacteraceae bacterium]
MSSGKVRASLTLGGLVIVVILLQGAAGLFALWYNHRQQAEMQGALAAAMTRLEAAQRAQAAFRIQVQEWKNVLLRGHDQTLLARHQASFEDHSRTVTEALRALGPRAEAARASHDAVDRSYAMVRAGADVTSAEGAREADARLRGIDRELQDMLDSLVDEQTEAVTEAFRTAEGQAASVYQSMRMMLLATAAIGSLAAVGLVFVASRR